MQQPNPTPGPTNPPPQNNQLAQPGPPSPREVSSQFTEKYYQIRTQRPDLLVKFYGPNSKVSLNDGVNQKVFTGPQEISEGINVFADARVVSHSINCTDIQGEKGGRGGYMLQVCGLIQRKSTPPQKFAQSFFLVHADQTQNHLVVSNDMITLFPFDVQPANVGQQALIHPYYMQMPQNSAAMMAIQQQQQQHMMAAQHPLGQAMPYGGRMEPGAAPDANNPQNMHQMYQMHQPQPTGQQPQMPVRQHYMPAQQQQLPGHPTPTAQMSPRGSGQLPATAIQPVTPQQPPMPVPQQQPQQQYMRNAQNPHAQAHPPAQNMPPNPNPNLHPQQQQHHVNININQYQQNASSQQQHTENTAPSVNQALPGPTYQLPGKHVTQSETQTDEQANQYPPDPRDASSGYDQSVQQMEQQRPVPRPSSAAANQNNTVLPPSKPQYQPAAPPQRLRDQPPQALQSTAPPQQVNHARGQLPSHTSADDSTSSSPQPSSQQVNGNGVVEVSGSNVGGVSTNHTSSTGASHRPTFSRSGSGGFGGGSGYNQGGPPLFSLFVHNLPVDVTEEKIKEIFSPYGQVRGFKIKPSFSKESNTPGEKSYAFVDFGSEEEMRTAVSQCDGMDVDGRQIIVQEKRPVIFSPYQSKGSYRGGGGPYRDARGGGRGGDARGRGRTDFGRGGRSSRGRDERGRGRSSYRSSTPTSRS
eukprot:TRINITY_DN2735_c1_g3_i1.p1 TRINITY_DN2735_c1_g3~~TRINITY_DN2735_c1_g3_i1.p1  ORF type:complete len:781 (-),score=89.31 TRINITY_DN2735_c1_g3_i1:1096-3180(-)